MDTIIYMYIKLLSSFTIFLVDSGMKIFKW